MKIFGIVWVASYCSLMLGLAISDIGEMPKCGDEPYTWALVLGVVGILVIPMFLSYYFGRNSRRDEP